MRKIFFLALLACLILGSCKNELYNKPFKSLKGYSQAAFISNENSLIQAYVADGQNLDIKGLKVNLVSQDNSKHSVVLSYGNQADLDSYNKANGTSYILLPKSMYEAPDMVNFEPLSTSVPITLKLKDVKLANGAIYALPVSLKSGSPTKVISAESKALYVFLPKLRTKCLRIDGSGTSKSKMFSDDYKVPQWTMECMINRSAYNQNNQALCGTKVNDPSNKSEIYPRFGDVTIKHDQLQIKTGNSQIDVPSEKFSAKPNEWYMLSFVYDGKTTFVYVNGTLVASREIRTGSYSVTGFWIGGANKFIREIRFYNVARSQKQIQENLWTMANPNDPNLLLYYPCNGKKLDKKTGKITDDETMLWDWSNSGQNLSVPGDAVFDDNGGKLFTFPIGV